METVIAYLTLNSETKSVFVAQPKYNIQLGEQDIDPTLVYDCYIMQDYDDTPRVEVRVKASEGPWALVNKGVEALRYSGYYAA